MRPARAHARSLEECLMADAGMARLSGHAKRLLRLQRALASVTPLNRQARVANLRLGTVVIHSLNGAVAAKLKQMTPRLLGVFRLEAAEVTGIDIRVQPDVEQRQPISKTGRTSIGAKQKHALTSLTMGLAEGSALRVAIERLVERSG